MVDCHPRVNLLTEQVDESCRHLISAEDAWEHTVLPLRMDDGGALICATTLQTSDQAARMLKRRLSVPFHFVMAATHQLEQYISEAYDFEGIQVGD